MKSSIVALPSHCIQRIGPDLAAKCHKKMKCLMPSLYLHLAPMSKAESLEIEEALANDFRAV